MASSGHGGGLHRLYSDLAHLWYLVSDPADYAEEAAFWRQVLRGKLGPGRHHLLELGVGGGNNLSHLVDEFDATAVDISPAMLAHCRRLIPGIDLHQGDMRSVRLGQVFDAVLIHDAVTYLTTEADLRATFLTAWEHLRPGGVLVVAPDYLQETFRDNDLRHDRNEKNGLLLTHIEYTWDPDPSDTTILCDMIYLLRKGTELTVEQDRHRLGLFPRRTWLELLAEAGFNAETADYPVHENPGQSCLFVGTRAR